MQFAPQSCFANPAECLDNLRKLTHKDSFGVKGKDMRITDPIPLIKDNWYSVVIQGERTSGGADHAADVRDAHTTRITLRIDPYEDVKESVEKHPAGNLKPWAIFGTSLVVDFKDIYSLGNTFDNQCSDATDDIEWSLGPLRNFELFGINKRWASGSAGKHRLMIHEAFPPDQTADDGFDAVAPEPERGKLVAEIESMGNEDRSQASPCRSQASPCDLLHRLAALSQQGAKGSRGAFRDDIGGLDGKQPVILPRYKMIAVFKHIHELKGFDRGSDLRQSSGKLGDAQVDENRDKIVGRIRLLNVWNEDYEPGFPYSSDIVDRKDLRFIQTKAKRTRGIIKAMLDEVPTELTGDKQCRYFEVDAGLNHGGELPLSAEACFVMRGKASARDPGLKTLFSGKQMRLTGRYMQRRVRIKFWKFIKILGLFLLPIYTVPKSLYTDFGGHKAATSTSMSAVEIVLRKMRETYGVSPKTGLILLVLCAWGLLVYMVAVAMQRTMSGQDSFQPMHSLEPTLAFLYYLWAAVILALQHATGLANLAGDDPFEVAYKKAELSLMRVSLTRIKDGQRVHCSGSGFLNMVCRLPRRHDDDDEEDEEDDEDDDSGENEDMFSVGKGTLRKLWMQQYLSNPVSGFLLIDRIIYNPRSTLSHRMVISIRASA